MSKERIWKSGPPPHVGWWNASVCDDDIAWRWWNGKVWSVVVYSSNSAEQVARFALDVCEEVKSIFWTDYWPKGASVPRIDPSLAMLGLSSTDVAYSDGYLAMRRTEARIAIVKQIRELASKLEALL